MTEEFLRELFTFLVPLLIIVDPLGNLPLFLLFTTGETVATQRRIAATASIVAAGVLLAFAVTGDAILRFFGIELAAFQVAGGLIFLIYALQMLRLIPSGIKTTPAEEEEGLAKEHVALVPLATPLIAGPGAITAVLVQRHNGTEAGGLDVVLLAIVLACLVEFLVFVHARRLQRILGVGGIRVAERLMGLLLAVIAVQFALSGLRALLGS